MLQGLRSNPVLWFLLSLRLLLIAWFVLYEFLLNPFGVIDRPVISNLIFFSGLLLRLFGYTIIESSFSEMRTIGVDGTNGVWIGDSCDGIALFAVFAIIILCFPGPWQKKAWFIPMGILIIHVINIIRVAVLAILVKYSPEVLNFNHTYTFQIIIYTAIFLLWMRWVNRYSGLRTLKKNEP